MMRRTAESGKRADENQRQRATELITGNRLHQIFLLANKITVSGRKNPEVYDLAGVLWWQYCQYEVSGCPESQHLRTCVRQSQFQPSIRTPADTYTSSSEAPVSVASSVASGAAAVSSEASTVASGASSAAAAS